LVGGAGLVNRLIERVLIDVPIEGVGADVPVVGVTKNRHLIGGVVPPGEIEKRGTVVRDIGRGVDARVVAGEKALLLHAVAGQRIIGVRHAEPERRPGVLPAELAEKLADVGRRAIAPSVFEIQIAREIPAQSPRTGAAMLEINCLAPENCRR